ncbi:hypothetical protein BDQ94DRAFT_60777 [Aspergillus welwitschiae]|uniref:Uncharacterized protein n=1 Tax=Aspergillus welwitschiae TaxID=1341132 RepID=A0A3F3PWZ0_9EURO|nr:hypothetical protein BDQ94DRAFT_60777 [Aspergillus welwitschiae]RDH31381.1 hypothetical protein BDQ94DRAFT_60777 [Aspergillus welwitschiae]
MPLFVQFLHLFFLPLFFFLFFFPSYDGALRTVSPPFVIVISFLISSVMFDVMFLVSFFPFFPTNSYQFTKQVWIRTKCLMRGCASPALICLLCLVWIDCVASLFSLFVLKLQ